MTETIEKNVQAEASLGILLMAMAQGIVDEPSKVTVEANEADGLVLLNLKASPADTGKLIGKHGRTARSMRTILGASARALRVRYELNIDGFAKEGGDVQEQATETE